MTAYLFILFTFTAAWAVVGFAAAVLFLKMRWNLVGGFCLVVFGWLPALCWSAAALFIAGSGQLPAKFFTIEGMLELGADLHTMAVAAGYSLGILLGTLVGFYPRTNEEGIRERRARSWPLWKTIVLTPLPLILAWGLFWLADVRAKDRLLDLRQQYQDYLAQQVDAAPNRSHDASSIHESIYIALMQDPLPDEVDIDFRDHTAQMLLPESEHLPTIREYCQRHEAFYDQLHEVVEQHGLKHHRWHRTVQRFVVLNAMLKIVDGDLASAEDDLRLLRHMGQHCLDEYRGDLFEYFSTEDLRGLLFQLMHASGQDIPGSVYEEMLTREEDWRWKIGRSMKRDIAQQVSGKVDSWLTEPEENGFSIFWQTAATRIVQQEHYPRVLAELEREMLYFFTDHEQRFTRFANSPFATMDPHHLPWRLTAAVDISVDLAIWQEIVGVASVAQQARDQTGQYPDWETMQTRVNEQLWAPEISLRYHTLRHRDTGELLLVVVRHPDHHWVGDNLALCLGPRAAEVYLQDFSGLAYRMNKDLTQGFWFEQALASGEDDNHTLHADDSTAGNPPGRPPQR